MMKPADYQALPRANKHLVAHEQPKGGKKMLYSITPEGKLKLHRDLSKWRLKTIGKKVALYFSEAQSPKEQAAESEFKALIGRCTKELTPLQEQGVISKAMRKQALKDALVNV